MRRARSLRPNWRLPAARAGVAAALLALWVGPVPAGTDPCEPADTAAALQQANALRYLGGPCGTGGFAPTGPLAWNPSLERMARRHAAWLARRGELLHAGERGEGLGQRAQADGYAFRRVTENLALGQRGLVPLMFEWLISPSHCANLLDPVVNEVALACASAPDGRPLWVMVFGRPI